MNDELEIRVATSPDVAHMKALSDSVTSEDIPWLGNHEVPEDVFQITIKQIETSSTSTTLLAWRGSDLVGQLDCAAREGHLSEFAITVHRKHRHSGVGQALLAKLLEWAHEQPELERLQAKVLEPNTAAQLLLQNHGFAIEARPPYEVTIRGQAMREEKWYLDV